MYYKHGIMKKFLLLTFSIVLFSAMKGFTQSPSIEKLKQQFNSLPDDTSKVYAFIEYAMEQENIDLDSATYYYQKANTLSEQLNFYPGKIKYALNYTVVLNIQGELMRSKELSQTALHLATYKKDSINMSKAHNNLGNAYNLMADFDSAFYHYMQSANLFSAIKMEDHLHILYSNIAIILHNLEQHEKAIEYSKVSMDYSVKAGDSIQLSSSMINLASVFSSVNKFDSAEALLHKAIPYLEKQGVHYPLATAYINLGNVQEKRGDHKESIKSFNRAIQYARAIQNTQKMGVAYNGLAMVYFYLRSFAEADRYSDEALRFIDLSQGADLLQLYKLKAGIKAELGEFATAYDFLLKYGTLNDSITGINTRKNVSDLEQKYQAAKKDNELLEKQLVIEESRDALKQKNFWLMIALGGILLSVTIAVLYYRFYKQKQKLHAKELLNLQQQQELESLQAGLEGQQLERKRIAAEMHDDLGSGLTSILFMADNSMNNAQKISENIPRIAEAARSVMNNMNEIVWSMNSEYDSLEDLISYIRHQSVELLTQFGMPYKFDMPNDIPLVSIAGTQRRNIHLVVKEALHNIIRHANAGLVKIHFSINSSDLEIVIADDGVGIKEEQLKRFGNGLRNMKQRMESIGGTWEMTNNNGSRIRLLLPIPL